MSDNGHAPKQPNEVLLTEDELRPGDRVFGREFDDWPNCRSDFEGHEFLRPGIVKTRAGEYEMKHLVGRGRWRTVRAAGMARCTPTGHWNGKCPACGLGTYTGFLTVEHEGGGCRT